MPKREKKLVVINAKRTTPPTMSGAAIRSCGIFSLFRVGARLVFGFSVKIRKSAGNKNAAI